MYTLQNEVDRLIEELAQLKPGTDEHNLVLGQLQKMITMTYALKELEKEETLLDRLLKSPGVISGLFTLGATAMVLYHERAEVITSRAFGWIRFK